LRSSGYKNNSKSEERNFSRYGSINEDALGGVMDVNGAYIQGVSIGIYSTEAAVFIDIKHKVF
jgi:hypothetical protein